jgi:hypothetical protein
MVRMPGFPRSMEKEKQSISTGPVEMTISKPPAPVEVFYRIAKVPGEIANCAVEEITIQGDRILDRKITSDRDNRVGTEARLMAIMTRRDR